MHLYVLLLKIFCVKMQQWEVRDVKIAKCPMAAPVLSVSKLG